MSCLDINSFREKYNFYGDEDLKVPTGYFSRVFMDGEEFSMSPDYIVKKQSLKMSHSFIKEIIYLHQINHPNIAKLVNFSHDGEYAYIALARGKPIQQMYWDAKAKSQELEFLRELVSDLVSALLFLSKYGIIHADLKVDNCIYSPETGRTQLIDFGLSKLGIPARIDHNYSDFIFRGIAYTPVYRDPSYLSITGNSIRTELFSITAIVYYLLKSSDTERRMIHNVPDQYVYMFNLKELAPDPVLRDFLEECQIFVDQRKTVEELSQHPYIIQERLLTGKLLINQNFAYPTREDTIQVLIRGYDYMMELKNPFLRSRTVFAAFELFRNIINCPDLFDVHNSSDKEIRNWALFSLYVSYSIYEFDSSEFDDDTSISDFIELDLYPLFCEVMNVSEGYLLYPSPWNSAFCPLDYKYLLHVMMQPGYDPNFAITLINTDLDERSKDDVFGLRLTGSEIYDLRVDYQQDDTPIYIVEVDYSTETQKQHQWDILSSSILTVPLGYPFDYSTDLANNNFKSKLIALIIKFRDRLAKVNTSQRSSDGNLIPLDLHDLHPDKLRMDQSVYVRSLRLLYSIMYPLLKTPNGTILKTVKGYNITKPEDFTKQKLSYMERHDTLLERLSRTDSFDSLMQKCLAVENEGINFFS